MLSFLGGIVSGLFFKLLEAFGLIEVGKKEQAAKDDDASLKDAKDARKIDARVAGLSDDALDRELRGTPGDR